MEVPISVGQGAGDKDISFVFAHELDPRGLCS